MEATHENKAEKVIDKNDFDYELLKVVGKGGSSTVYKGILKDCNTTVAIKQIDTDGISEDQKANIQGEIDTIKALSHPHIVSYLGTKCITSEHQNKILIFLEYADRGSLRQFYQRRGALTEPQAANCTRQILEGLIYLHNNGIAHRDIKCANCLLTKGGVIKLADFGASKRFESDSVVSGLKGTPHWMAPEVIKGTNMTTGWIKSDVWSVGCTVVEMMTGKVPFAEYDNPMTAMYHIANGEQPPIGENVVASDDLKSFLAACCDVNPELRPTAEKLNTMPYPARPKKSSNVKPKKTKEGEEETAVPNQPNNLDSRMNSIASAAADIDISPPSSAKLTSRTDTEGSNSESTGSAPALNSSSGASGATTNEANSEAGGEFSFAQMIADDQAKKAREDLEDDRKQEIILESNRNRRNRSDVLPDSNGQGQAEEGSFSFAQMIADNEARKAKLISKLDLDDNDKTKTKEGRSVSEDYTDEGEVSKIDTSVDFAEDGCELDLDDYEERGSSIDVTHSAGGVTRQQQESNRIEYIPNQGSGSGNGKINRARPQGPSDRVKIGDRNNRPNLSATIPAGAVYDSNSNSVDNDKSMDSTISAYTSATKDILASVGLNKNKVQKQQDIDAYGSADGATPVMRHDKKKFFPQSNSNLSSPSADNGSSRGISLGTEVDISSSFGDESDRSHQVSNAVYYSQPENYTGTYTGGSYTNDTNADSSSSSAVMSGPRLSDSVDISAGSRPSAPSNGERIRTSANSPGASIESLQRASSGGAAAIRRQALEELNSPNMPNIQDKDKKIGNGLGLVGIDFNTASADTQRKRIGQTKQRKNSIRSKSAGAGSSSLGASLNRLPPMGGSAIGTCSSEYAAATTTGALDNRSVTGIATNTLSSNMAAYQDTGIESGNLMNLSSLASQVPHQFAARPIRSAPAVSRSETFALPPIQSQTPTSRAKVSLDPFQTENKLRKSSLL